MKRLLFLLVVLAGRAASVEDLSGKMFVFPAQNSIAHVKLITPKQVFSALTVCHRSFTDLKRDHSLFSMSTPSYSNAFLLFWDDTNKEMESHVRDQKAEFARVDYKLNMWHSICTTWDSTSGLTQLWFNGRPSIWKFINSLGNITGNTNIVIGQEQDSHGGGFDSKQSFVGMMSDVHMWDYVLSGCEIQNYVDEVNFTPGNVLNWRAMEYQIADKVLLKQKNKQCH